jgi:hypothetical protein
VNMFIVQGICSFFQTIFGERGTLLCPFNWYIFVQLDKRFTYLMWTKYTVFLFFLCVLYVRIVILVLYCVCLWSTCCYTNWGFSVLFSLVVWKMLNYYSQKRGTARTSQISFIFVDFYAFS